MTSNNCVFGINEGFAPRSKSCGTLPPPLQRVTVLRVILKGRWTTIEALKRSRRS
jgi:hypothetical protein